MVYNLIVARITITHSPHSALATHSPTELHEPYSNMKHTIGICVKVINVSSNTRD